MLSESCLIHKLPLVKHKEPLWCRGVIDYRNRQTTPFSFSFFTTVDFPPNYDLHKNPTKLIVIFGEGVLMATGDIMLLD